MQKEVLVGNAGVFFAIDEEALLLASRQPAFEGESAVIGKLEAGLDGAAAVAHLGVGFAAGAVDELAQVVVGQPSLLVAEAEHHGVEQVGFARPVGPHYRRHLQQRSHVHCLF